PTMLGVVVPVEVADLVRTVVGAIARAHAPIVDLAVQAVRCVVGGVYGAHGLTGRVTALLAQHRRHDRAHPTRSPTRVIALDPQPAHLPPAHHQLLAHRREIVLRVARGDARGAPRTLREVDGHRPARLLAGV